MRHLSWYDGHHALTRDGSLFAQRHPTQAQSGRKQILVDCQERQIGSFKTAFLDDARWISLTGNHDLGSRHPRTANHVCGRKEQAAAKIYSIAWPRLDWRSVNVDRVCKQRVAEILRPAGRHENGRSEQDDERPEPNRLGEQFVHCTLTSELRRSWRCTELADSDGKLRRADKELEFLRGNGSKQVFNELVL
jgi:hypothetical protein